MYLYNFTNSKQNQFTLYIFLNNTHLSLYLINNENHNTYNSNFTIDDLIKISVQFNQFNSLYDIYNKLIEFIDYNKENISIEQNNNTIFLYLVNFIEENNIKLSLCKIISNKRRFTIQNNHLQLITNTAITNHNNNSNLLNFSSVNKKEHTLIYILYTSSLLLMISLVIFMCNFIIPSYLPIYSKIATQNEMNLISKWISPLYKIKYTLLYRASRDGDSAEIFHKLCDEKGPTLTLIETTEGFKFGGFTEVNWTSPTGPSYRQGKNIFIFSLDLQKKYPARGGQAEIYCRKNNGPSFGFGPDIRIEDNCFTKNSSNFSPISFSDMEIMDEFCGGENRFLVKDIEVYLTKIKN